ncbi:putative reverse transcriptase, RNA-dependent DNA polymerase [Tanacetum coccineum]
MVKVKGQMLKEKKDPGAFLFPIRLEGRVNENALDDTGSDTNTMPYRIYEQLGRDDNMKEERNITMINHTEAEVTTRLVNVLCQFGFTTLSAKFLILEIPVDRDTLFVVSRGFLDTIGGNIEIPNKTFTTFDGLTRQTFRAARSEKIRIAESDSDDEEDFVIKRNEMGTPIHNFRPIVYQNNTNLAENMTLSTLESVINPFRKISVWKKALKLKRRFSFSVAWVRAFNIREPIYLELCHEFYATYEFDEVCMDNELQSKKIINFRLGGRAHSLTLLEFARILGLYHVDELEEKGFDTYFQGGLRNDENFNAREY